MSQTARTLFPGCPHHVVLRGYRKRDIFCHPRDRLEFIECMAAATPAAGVQVWAYALMRNHVHLIAVPDDNDSIAIAMTRCLSDYTPFFLARHPATGALWHERLHAPVVSPRYFWDAVRYVERNPVRAGIVDRAEAYKWSSAAYHCDLRREDPLVSPDSPLKGALADWSAWLRTPDLDGRLASIRRKNRTAPATGGEFLGKFEHALDRRISARCSRRGATAKRPVTMDHSALRPV